MHSSFRFLDIFSQRRGKLWTCEDYFVVVSRIADSIGVMVKPSVSDFSACCCQKLQITSWLYFSRNCTGFGLSMSLGSRQLVTLHSFRFWVLNTPQRSSTRAPMVHNTIFLSWCRGVAKTKSCLLIIHFSPAIIWQNREPSVLLDLKVKIQRAWSIQNNDFAWSPASLK